MTHNGIFIGYFDYGSSERGGTLLRWFRIRIRVSLNHFLARCSFCYNDYVIIMLSRQVSTQHNVMLDVVSNTLNNNYAVVAQINFKQGSVFLSCIL